MKQIPSLLSAIVFLFFGIGCTPIEQSTPSESGNEGDLDNKVHVTGISLDQPSATIKEGEYITLIATVTPSNADNKEVSWSSNSESVAIVDNSGKVTGVKAGSATITATAIDGEMKAICSISVEANLAPSVTIEANHLSAISAVLAGKANLGSTVAADLQVGFQYSESAGILPSNSITIEATNADKDFNYTSSITGLKPATTYYFHSFVRQNNQYTYGETKEFTTKELSSLIHTQAVTDIEATTAKLIASLDLTDVQYSTKEYGFYWGASEESQPTELSGGDIEGNTYSASLTNLSHKTQYWYKAYVKLDSQSFYGDIKAFTTDVVPVESVSLDKLEYTFHTIGNTITLTATVIPSDATNNSLEWSTDKEDVATVDSNGNVTATGNGSATITVKTQDQGKTSTCIVSVTQWATSISLDKPLISLGTGSEATLSVTILPDNTKDKSVTWTSSDNAIVSVDNNGRILAMATGNATIKATANDGSGVYGKCTVNVIKAPEAVDLGIIVNGKSIKWGSFNIGASNPEDYGGLYAWGETATKSYYAWSTYKFSNGSASPCPLSKYNTISGCGTVDNKTILEPEDDAANVKLGGKWRMPTSEEWNELRTKCIWTWTDNYNGTGIMGRVVTASNGNSIFLPAAGFRRDLNLYSTTYRGEYWSSSLNTNSTDRAWYMSFSSDNVDSYNDYRRHGRSVRPVYEE